MKTTCADLGAVLHFLFPEKVGVGYGLVSWSNRDRDADMCTWVKT